LAEFPDFSIIEAKAYLELADWKLKDAIRSAKDDHEWEMEQNSDLDNEQRRNSRNESNFCSNNKDVGSNATTASCTALKSGEIRIIPKLNHVGEPIGFHTKGAGIKQQSQESSPPTPHNLFTTTAMKEHDTNPTTNDIVANNTPKIQTVSMTEPSEQKDTDATLTMPLPQRPDIYAQHNNFGVELQSFTAK
jgi:hypothetical protein